MQIKKINITFILILISSIVFSQPINTNNIKDFGFIQMHKNQFLYTSNNTNFEQFYKLLDNCVRSKSNQVNILHIGDSHLQANIFSNKLRQNLSNQFNLNVGRGLVFPYKVAKSSRAIDFEITSFSSDWTFNKNLEKLDTNNLGITGYSISTVKDSSFFTCKFLNDTSKNIQNYVVNIWHKKSDFFKITIEDKTADSTKIYDNDLMISSFHLNQLKKDSIKFQFSKDSTITETMSVYGFEIEKTNEVFKYHSEGVNGAEVVSWLKSNQLISQIKILNPSLIIISLGTNDGYKETFEEKDFISNYTLLIEKIRNNFPQIAILLTTSGDSYQNKTVININNEKIRFAILSLAKKYNCGVWDFYDIMGGLNSISKWHENKLCQDDLLHFNKNGYMLIADLFYIAFMNDYANFMIK